MCAAYFLCYKIYTSKGCGTGIEITPSLEIIVNGGNSTEPLWYLPCLPCHSVVNVVGWQDSLQTAHSTLLAHFKSLTCFPTLKKKYCPNVILMSHGRAAFLYKRKLRTIIVIIAIVRYSKLLLCLAREKSFLEGSAMLTKKFKEMLCMWCWHPKDPILQ